MSILFKGNLEEGNYTLIKSTDGWVLKGETSYAGFNFADRPKGEWIKEHGVVNCSNCNHSHWSDCYEDTVVRFNFCPNCGADMREREGE